MANYDSYSPEEFIQDEFFLKWARDNNKEAATFWQKWLASHPEKQNDIEAARYAVQNMQYSTLYQLSDSEHTEIFENILRAETVSISTQPLKKYPFLRYVAVLIPLLVTTLYIYLALQKAPGAEEAIQQQVVFEERYYPKGRKSTLRLADSSQVTVNADSKVKFPRHFRDMSSREVYLEGEAFFQVKRDTSKPFRVYTDKLVTEVLGTSFNVDADPTDEQIQVTVATGKVLVSDPSGNRIVLQAGEYVVYSKRDSTFSKKYSNDLEHILGWKEGKLIFEREPLQDVFKTLERWYGVKFLGEEKITGSYTGYFHDKTLEKVLEGIAYTSNFNYEIKGKTIIIK